MTESMPELSPSHKILGDEILRLRELVGTAYSEGFNEGAYGAVSLGLDKDALRFERAWEISSTRRLLKGAPGDPDG